MIRFIKELIRAVLPRKRAKPSSDAESALADEAATDEESTDADASTPSEPTAPPAIPDAVEVEFQRRFNEFEHRFNERQREILDYRENSINRWLAIVAIVLTVFGIAVPIVGIWGFKEFEEIKTQAQGYVKEIKQYRDEAESLTQDINAEIVADNPTKAKQVIEDVRENPKASSTDKAIAKAVSLQKQGKEEEALKIWRGIADAFEEVDRELAARAWFSVGVLFFLQEKHEDAISAYNQAIRLKPDLAKAYDNRGVAKDELGRYEAAIADHNQAIRLKPDLAEAYNNRGVAKNNLGRREAAITDYDEAIRLKPDLAKAYNNRGVAKDEQGHHEAAITDYDEAIRLKPDFAEVYYNRGIAKDEQGRREAAITDYDEAIRLKPDYADAYIRRGDTKIHLGRIDEARQDFEKVRDLARKASNASLVASVEQRLRDLDTNDLFR